MYPWADGTFPMLWLQEGIIPNLIKGKQPYKGKKLRIKMGKADERPHFLFPSAHYF